MNTLSENEVAGALEPLQAWTLAEKADHHPDVMLSYSHLTLRLVSHDAGGITERDLELARALSALKTA
jgi:4a-hydroxytetrahydrobiopterin dehydratase